MKTLLVPALLVIGGLWAWWAKRRMQRAHLRVLLRWSAQDPIRAGRVTFAVESLAALIAVVALAVAALAEHAHGWWWVRVPLSLAVLLAYVPYTMTLARVRIRMKVRRPPRERLMELGASPAVAGAIARAGQPFAYLGSLVMIAAVLVFLWHLFG